MLNLPLCHWSSQLFDLPAPWSTEVPVLLLNQPIFLFTTFTSLCVREPEFWNPENFCLWNPKSEKILESGTLGFGIRNINKAHGIQNPSSTGKDWKAVPGIRNPVWSPESETVLDSGGSRPSDKGRGGSGHPDPEIGGGGRSPKNFFRPFGPHFGRKVFWGCHIG